MRTTIQLNPWTDRERVRAIWTDLEATAHPAPPYFLTWAWVENWLVTLPPTTHLHMVAILDDDPDGTALAAWFIGERVAMHGGMIPIRARFLNETGDPEFDELTIEHNGWLARPHAHITIADVVGALEPGWDELVLSALAGDPTAVEPPWPAHYTEVGRVAAHFVDLAKVRAREDYLDLLARDCRSQIRRAERIYTERGPLHVAIASDHAEARAIFDGFVALHAASWAGRGAAGAFSPYMLRFHARLIDERFAAGDIQLVRVSSGGTTVGCLYNFVRDRDIAFYQSGFAYEQDNRLKPGLVCHAAAIRFCANAGYRIYDFLGGDARYKRSLATDTNELVTATVQQPCVRFAMEHTARNLLRRYRALRAA